MEAIATLAVISAKFAHLQLRAVPAIQSTATISFPQHTHHAAHAPRAMDIGSTQRSARLAARSAKSAHHPLSALYVSRKTVISFNTLHLKRAAYAKPTMGSISLGISVCPAAPTAKSALLT